MAWFRFYDDTPFHSKMVSLSRADKWVWVELLCLASREAKEQGVVGELDAICRQLGGKFAANKQTIVRLIAADLLINGSVLKIKNWDKRQYKSDVSTDRVRRHRAKGNGDETFHETAPEQSRAETEQIYTGDRSAKRSATRPDFREPLDRFWIVYPKRDGANPRLPAEKKFIAACKSGEDPEAIIAGAKRYADELRSKDQVGTPYVAQAVTWLNQKRWLDYGSTGPPVNGWKPPPGAPTSDELREKWRKVRAENRGAGLPPVASGSAEPRPSNGVVRGQTEHGTSGGVGELFPPSRMASRDV